MLERKERKNVGQIECEYSDLKTGKMPGRMSKKMSDCRRKFRSQISDRDGKGQREEKRREDQRRERVRRKKMQVREKVGKSRNTVFFQ